MNAVVVSRDRKFVRVFIRDTLDISTYESFAQYYEEHKEAFKSFDECVFSLASHAAETEQRKW